MKQLEKEINRNSMSYEDHVKKHEDQMSKSDFKPNTKKYKHKHSYNSFDYNRKRFPKV